MWKQLREKVRTQQRESKAVLSPLGAGATPLDGGFFEKLGDLLRKHAENKEFCGGRSDVTARAANGGDENGIPYSGVESFLLLSDSDLAVDQKAELVSDAMGSNIEALYLDVLYMILHTVGCEASSDDERTALITFIQAALKFDDETHNKLLEQAKSKEAPSILLHVNVVEGKDIKPMDVNGLSDTFLTLYLTSNPDLKHNTSVKLGTLCPKWSEHFCLSVQNPVEDALCIEAWDFDPAETIHEKMMKIGEVKGIKGLGKLVQEFAVTGKNENEFIGSCLVPMKSIPASGEILWCNLKKKGRTGIRGSVKLKLVFSSEKNSQATFKAHRNLVRYLLQHHLVENKIEPYEWNGNFSTCAENILTQHLVHSGLTSYEDLLVKWIEYCGIHVCHPISFGTFSSLLEKIIKPLQNNSFDKENEMLFWEGARKLMPSCLNGIRKLNILEQSEKNVCQLAGLLRIISHLTCLQLPENFILFSSSTCEWLLSIVDNDCDLITVTKLTISYGTQDWYRDLIQNNIRDQETSPEARLIHLIKVVQEVMTVLQRASEVHDKVFQEYLQLEYAEILFSAHEQKISEMVETSMKEVYKVLKPVKFNSELSSDHEDQAISLGINLFDLYLTLQRFVQLGTGLYPRSDKKYKISEYYVSFHRSAAHWLDIALWKATHRITKAVELDELIPVSSTVHHSSSAVDTLCIYNSIKEFWKNVSWPNVEGSYVFVTKIVDDICHCSVFYAEVMSARVELTNKENNSEIKFNITKEWCLAINNIEYIRCSIVPFLKELGVDGILKELLEIKGTEDTERCKSSLHLVIGNAVDTVSNKISELLEKAVEKMMPTIKTFFMKVTEEKVKDKDVETLLHYLENNLRTLNTELRSEIFEEILSLIWRNVANMISKTIEACFEEKQPRMYFVNLRDTLEIIVNFFSGDDDQHKMCDVKELQEVKAILDVHCMETSQLIHKFYLERYTEQNLLENAPWGLITIKAEIVENLLQISILSCRNLLPMDSNGSCDPYVEITLLPAEQFLGNQKQRTKTHKKTLFPLFDENFTFKLNGDQKPANDSVVLLTVKDQDLLRNELVGEAFIPFADIVRTETTNGRQELEQIHLKLSIPKNLDSLISNVLKYRQADKIAKEFIKKQKTKVEAHRQQ